MDFLKLIQKGDEDFLKTKTDIVKHIYDIKFNDLFLIEIALDNVYWETHDKVLY